MAHLVPPPICPHPRHSSAIKPIQGKSSLTPDFSRPVCPISGHITYRLLCGARHGMQRHVHQGKSRCSHPRTAPSRPVIGQNLPHVLAHTVGRIPWKNPSGGMQRHADQGKSRYPHPSTHPNRPIIGQIPPTSLLTPPGGYHGRICLVGCHVTLPRCPVAGEKDQL